MTDQIEIEPYIDKESGEQKNKFHFKFGEFESHATLLDLPCVIESHKTLDDINFFKSQNISQMIYVHPHGEKDLEQVENYQKHFVKIKA